MEIIGLHLGFNRFHVLTEEPGEMSPVRRVGGVVGNLDVNNPVILILVGGSKDPIVIVSAPFIPEIISEWSLVFNLE